MEKRDYYEILTVERTATEKDIKRAYKKLALELHPDRNPGDASAEERFKEASEAYQVLSDERRRSLYDQFGHAGLSGQAGAGFNDVQDIFSQFGDLFGEVFGGGGFRRGRRAGPQRGADLRTGVRLTLEQAAFGVKKEVKLAHPATCEPCDGSGGQGGERVACPRCQGTGQVAHSRGPFLLQTTCPHCQGQGSTVVTPCEHCKGAGQVDIERTVKVTFPEGIDDGQTLRVPEQGLKGTRGAPPGHLYVEVQVEPDPRFQREGAHLIHRVSLSFPRLALGTDVQIEGLDHKMLDVHIPAGSQVGDTVVVKSQGVPHLNRGGRGDLVVLIHVDVPRKLSRKAKKLLEELADALD